MVEVVATMVDAKLDGLTLPPVAVAADQMAVAEDQVDVADFSYKPILSNKSQKYYKSLILCEYLFLD